MGVRASDGASTNLLRQALDRYVVDDADALPNYSLQLAEDTAHFHHLYLGKCPELRTLDIDRLLTAFRLHLARHEVAGPGLVDLGMVGFVDETGAWLLPGSTKPRAIRADRRLRRSRLQPARCLADPRRPRDDGTGGGATTAPRRGPVADPGRAICRHDGGPRAPSNPAAIPFGTCSSGRSTWGLPVR